MREQQEADAARLERERVERDTTLTKLCKDTMVYDAVTFELDFEEELCVISVNQKGVLKRCMHDIEYFEGSECDAHLKLANGSIMVMKRSDYQDGAFSLIITPIEPAPTLSVNEDNFHV